MVLQTLRSRCVESSSGPAQGDPGETAAGGTVKPVHWPQAPGRAVAELAVRLEKKTREDLAALLERAGNWACAALLAL